MQMNQSRMICVSGLEEGMENRPEISCCAEIVLPGGARPPRRGRSRPIAAARAGGAVLPARVQPLSGAPAQEAGFSTVQVEEKEYDA